MLPLIMMAQTQKGNDIDGEAARDYSGYSVSMPDSNTVAIGAYANSGNGLEAGHVRIFSWQGSKWVQKGSDIDGEKEADWSGCSISMPDSNTIAIGAKYNRSNGFSAGHVRIFKWNGNAWIQKGSDIDGDSTDLSGTSVSMPDSNTLAIGAPNNDGNGFNAGHVRIFKWNGNAWIQKGNDIDGEAAEDESGTSVCMPDSNTVAIGAPWNDDNGFDAGHVRIFTWTGSAWVQKGNDIDGEAANDLSGIVSMPDANTVAIGAAYNDGNGFDAGHVRIFKWNGIAWIQKGSDIDGKAVLDLCGMRISMPDSNTIAIAASNSSLKDSNAGQVRIYTWENGKWMQKGWDINGEAAGDWFGSSVSMPNADIVAAGAYLNNGSGYNAGHVRIYSTLCNNTSGTISLSNCDSFISPSGHYQWTASGTYLDTILNVAGCDSLMTIHLTINRSTSVSIDTSVCSKYASPSGKYVWTSGGTYMDTIANAAGCDSLMTINLTIKNTSVSIDTSVCNSYASPSGKYVWTSGGTYMDTIANAAGCDSLMTINLTINKSTLSSIYPKACYSYTSPSGKYIWTSGGTYMDTIINAAGCDSIMTINLTIDTVDVSITNLSPILKANATGAGYQWLNCDNAMAVISGETNQIFKALNNGNYAVEITQNGCIDTSVCENVNNIGIQQNDFGDKLEVFPNPNDGKLSVYLGNEYTNVCVIVRTETGQEAAKHTFSNTSKFKLSLPEEKGIYFIEVIADEKRALLKIFRK